MTDRTQWQDRGRIIQEEAKCAHCPCPLTRYYGKWSHHWLYANACRTPEIVPGTHTRDGEQVTSP